jgi:hypothetical protein
MPTLHANEAFRADHVRFGRLAVVQVLMRSDVPAAEAFFRDHLRVLLIDRVGGKSGRENSHITLSRVAHQSSNSSLDCSILFGFVPWIFFNRSSSNVAKS